MIIIGSKDFVLGFRFCGAKTFVHSLRKDTLEKIRKLEEDEMIIASQQVVDDVEEILSFQNLSVFPDKVSEFGDITDLQRIIKDAIGIEVSD